MPTEAFNIHENLENDLGLEISTILHFMKYVNLCQTFTWETIFSPIE